jgi:predicted double-glycine peptidase
VLAAATRAADAPPPFMDWRALRDAKVIKQQRDYSCGLASLATLLRHYYGVPVSEDALLDALRQRDGAEQFAARYGERGVSLADLAWLARAHGFDAAGVSVPAGLLTALDRPALVYLEQGGMPHFSVLRGVGVGGEVLLADPTAGNLRVSQRQFGRWFLPGDAAAGRVLLLRDAQGGVERTGNTAFSGYRPRSAVLAPSTLLGSVPLRR